MKYICLSNDFFVICVCVCMMYYRIIYVSESPCATLIRYKLMYRLSVVITDPHTNHKNSTQIENRIESNMIKHQNLFEKQNKEKKTRSKGGIAMSASLISVAAITAFVSTWKSVCDEEMCMETLLDVQTDNITMQQARHGLPKKFGFNPMPLYDEIPWSREDQWIRVFVYVAVLIFTRKFVIEKVWHTTWDQIQMRKIVVGCMMVWDIYNSLCIDNTGNAVYPVWGEIAMVIENLVLLRKELMTSPAKWAHDILLLVSFLVVTEGFYTHSPDKEYSRKYMHLHGSIFYAAWMIEAVFLFCNHRLRRPTMNSTFMKGFHVLTIGCCLHNIFFLVSHAVFVFYDTYMPLAIALGFAQQWSLWTYKIYSKGVR